jgi:protein disulfide-isomerase A1
VPSLLDDDAVIFLAHVGPGDDDYRNQFKALAARYRDSYTFIMTGPLEGRSALHCFNNINEEEHTTEPLAKVGGLEAFIKRCSAPLIPELTRANEADYTGVSSDAPPSRPRTAD